MSRAGRRTICVVTGSRADYGYLRPLMRLAAADPGCLLQVVVTGMHLWPAFGDTWREIEADGFGIDQRVALPFTGTGALDVAGCVGAAVPLLAAAFQRLEPDFVVLLGDRYETFAAALGALFARVPVAHLAGGDVTEGAFDEALRHGITKMAHLHFTTNERSSRRVVQLGEDPARVFTVGATSLDDLLREPPMPRAELERELGFTFLARNVLVTYHPVTLDPTPPATQCAELLGALDDLGAGKELGVVCTAPNADTGGLDILALLERWAAGRPGILVRKSLGMRRYFGALAAVDAVVGNSSSGIYEAPSFKVPTVDIGARQRGRMRAASVLHCAPGRAAIADAVGRALALDCSQVVNPYGDGQASGRILAALKAEPDPQALLMKRFFDLPGEGGHV
ncbi:UDP-N-acetylglucosamine 2-epimerase [Desulfocurvus vexinensis]|uniref:UDP-N-acetylglucosamine 2-epimerase n=1 Tax=Desulfocurvus vexinensis TaxID=399548 RepID=UPI00049045D7|nr:UDP-N-acetylglucosamine 2-epimerase [Desulfocurvus vexinensis]